MDYQQLPFGIYGFGMATLIIAIMLSISGIVLGIGYALDDKRLKEFGRSEIYQSIINAAMVGGLLALFASNGIITSFMNNITYSSSSSFSCPEFMSNNAALCFAYNYLAGSSPYTFMGSQHSSLLSTISGMLFALIGLAIVLGIIAGIRIDLLVASFSFSNVLNPFLSELQHIITITAAAFVGISVQASVLSFVALTATTVILPTGLILRSFYLTRRVGGFFISLAIGLYVVLPLSYLLNAFLMNSYSTSINQTSIESVTSTASSFSGSLDGISSYNSTNETSNGGIVGMITGGISSVANSVSGIFSSLLAFVSGLVMQVFILPAFSLAITYISIRELARALGSEAAFGGLIKMV
ncbi:MAG: hypothetical protein ACP5K9_00835 [Candidatus Micrarchaeia archaeon]